MYDPARDTFTSSSAAQATEEDVEPASNDAPKPPVTLNSKAAGEGTADSHEPRTQAMATASAPRKRRVSSSHSPQKKVKLASSDSNTRIFSRRSPPPQEPAPTSPKLPSPPPKSPPRQRKRPGAASRIAETDKEALRQRQIEREKEQLSEARALQATRGDHEFVRQHYNAVPQRGREWRQKESRIRGLRNYNNWVKSTLIQKFSPNEGYNPHSKENGLVVLDIGCGKGGDLGKWAKAPQPVDLYIGIDPAEVSITQARTRYIEQRGRARGKFFRGEFYVKDGFGEWVGEIPFVREVGIDGNVGPGRSSRWGGGGFDVVTMMFCMHYAFENEMKARGMLKNVAGALKKGGRFIGVIPNSDVLRSKVEEFYKQEAAGHDKEISNGAGEKGSKVKGQEGIADVPFPEWGNGIYRVRFPGKTPEDGIFRPPFGWKYSYFMEEAVEEVPEYVVPWEAFRALAEDYNLELRYRKPFADIWKEEGDDPILGPLSLRMGVKESSDGPLKLTEEELEAVSFYHAFCFYKV
jgi:mRNA (guanine-N7-)-methyltransferase